MSKEVTVQCHGRDEDGSRCQRMTSRTRYCPEHLKSIWGVSVKESGVPGAGLGLFAERDFKKGENIVEYRGHVVILLDPSSSSESESEEEEPIGGPYVVQTTRHMFIDAARTDSEGRYVNAAPKGKHNNAQLVYDARKRVANVRARVKIAAGKEIFMGYGGAYWRALKKKKK